MGGCLSWCTRCPAPLVAASWVLHLLPSVATTAGAWLGSGTNSHPLHGVVSPYVFFSPPFLPRGDLEIISPELGDVGCTYVPRCHQYRQRISREWGSPRVRYPQAEKVSPCSMPLHVKGVPGSQGRNSPGRDCLHTCLYFEPGRDTLAGSWARQGHPVPALWVLGPAWGAVHPVPCAA